ncbi:hypothetical protein VSDG_05326 [Cytospora chrysosperma]|uniref:Wax synthase domain-containing protein n=1 Tax=Cytospora chrysosperma TaxID=252740 RepID=A0A423VX89_CYTCH|nr:hypothetical protein VSDG_05326 [Valsa sordida]
MFPFELLEQLTNAAPRPGLHPIPGTTPLTLEAAICPPLVYYVALLFLPPSPPSAVETTALKLLRNGLALLAGFLFLRLPLAHHVPQSIGLTYQLGLVGLYGSARVLDAFFISPYLFGHVPRRVRYKHVSRVSTPIVEGLRDVRKDGKPKNKPVPRATGDDSVDFLAAKASPDTTEGGNSATQFSATDLMDNVPGALDEFYLLLQRTVSGPDQRAVTEYARTEDGWPHSFLDRASWALELELSMRGVGFTWSTADVRHTRKTWLPTVQNRLHSIFLRVIPTLALCFVTVRAIYLRYDLQDVGQAAWGHSRERENLFDTRLPFPVQLLLTAALGTFLMAAFSFAHSAFAILCSPLAPHALAYFPPLYTARTWDITSVRQFWSYGWHRLFARLFLVYGVWPGEWLERKLTGKRGDEPADVGKVMGGFLSSALCHSFAVRGVLGGEWRRATGEASFFAVNGVAVVIEEGAKRVVMRARKRTGDGSLERWYDGGELVVEHGPLHEVVAGGAEWLDVDDDWKQGESDSPEEHEEAAEGSNEDLP